MSPTLTMGFVCKFIKTLAFIIFEAILLWILLNSSAKALASTSRGPPLTSLVEERTENVRGSCLIKTLASFTAFYGGERSWTNLPRILLQNVSEIPETHAGSEPQGVISLVICTDVISFRAHSSRTIWYDNYVDFSLSKHHLALKHDIRANI